MHDYLAVGLTKVKQTRAWKSEKQLQGYSWVSFKSEIVSLPLKLTDPIAIKYRNIIKAAAKEAGYNYQDVITAIEIYANDCSGQLHHAGIEQLSRNGITLTKKGQEALDEAINRVIT